jgi:hypothetical protein
MFIVKLYKPFCDFPYLLELCLRSFLISGGPLNFILLICVGGGGLAPSPSPSPSFLAGIAATAAAAAAYTSRHELKCRFITSN